MGAERLCAPGSRYVRTQHLPAAWGIREQGAGSGAWSSNWGSQVLSPEGLDSLPGQTRAEASPNGEGGVSPA